MTKDELATIRSLRNGEVEDDYAEGYNAGIDAVLEVLGNAVEPTAPHPHTVAIAAYVNAVDLSLAKRIGEGWELLRQIAKDSRL